MENIERNKMPFVRFMVIFLAICMVAYIVYTNFVSDILPKDIDARVRIATGIDLIGAFTQKDDQVKAYKAQSEYLSQRNLTCINDFNWSERNIETFLTKVKDKSHINALSNDELNRVDKCLNQIIDGPKRLAINASSSAPKSSDVNAVVPKVQSANQSTLAVSQSEPKLIKSVPYRPKENGLDGIIVSNLGNNPYTIKCRGSYSQLWSQNGQRDVISCEGVTVEKMQQDRLNTMPIRGEQYYGRLLINNQFLKKSYTSDTVAININIPQNTNAYSDIKGELIIDFYQL